MIKKVLLRILIGCIIVVVSLMGLTLALSVYLSPNDLRDCLLEENCQEVDAVVVISGGDTMARVDEGVRLYSLGLSRWLIVAGAAADRQGPSNAMVMKERAIYKGVPADHILMDEHSNDTNENARHVRQIVENNNIESIILVTSAYHQRRAYLEFSYSLGRGVRVYNSPVATDNSWERLWWLTPHGWWLALSEVVKITVVHSQQRY